MNSPMRGVAAILRAAKLFGQFRNGVLANPDFYKNDYLAVKRRVDTSPAQYRGEPVDFLYQPMFFTGKDIKTLESLSYKLVNILKKAVSEYRFNPHFRSAFNYPSIMEELVLCDPGYGLDFPIARFDLFYLYDGKIKFCEFNTDGTSSMHESSVLHQIFSKSQALSAIGDGFSFYDFELIDSWINCLFENYKNFSGKTSATPNVAIMDFEGEGTLSEFFEFKNRISASGCHAIICDPRELRYIGGKLYYKDIRIDLIYRRAITARLIDEAASITDFLKAYRDGNVCVVGGLVSQIVHNKILFAILHDQSLTYFLSSEDKAFIDAHIPYTAALNGQNFFAREYAMQNKDSCILKPCDLYAARGVIVGKDTSYDEWKRLIYEKSSQNYIVQEFHDPPKIEMCVTNGDYLSFEPFNYMLGLFMYNQKFSGIYTRVGRKNIIASVAESFTLPNFILAEKTASKSCSQ